MNGWRSITVLAALAALTLVACESAFAQEGMEACPPDMEMTPSEAVTPAEMVVPAEVTPARRVEPLTPVEEITPAGMVVMTPSDLTIAADTADGYSLATYGGAVPKDATQAPVVVIEMTDDMRYNPGQVTIAIGDMVEWRNSSRMGHTVTCDPRLARDPNNVALPEGAQVFNSLNIAPGRTYRYTFLTAGEYRYFCIPHESQGMVGEVTVLEGRQ